MAKVARDILSKARQLRKDMTPQERKLWYLFLRTYPVKIYKQRVIESFVADFYCASARLVIEVDGAQHYMEIGQEYDRKRSEILERHGLKVLRFSNREIELEFHEVCNEIDRLIKERSY